MIDSRPHSMAAPARPMSHLLVAAVALAAGLFLGRELVPAREPNPSEPGAGVSRQGAARTDARKVSGETPQDIGAGSGGSPTQIAAVLPAAAVPSSPQASDLRADEREDIDIFRRASAAVVHITSVEYQRDFFFDVQQMRQGTGSGFIWDRNGHIVTNYHVIQDASELKVKLSDQSVYGAQLVGVAPEKDLAVLKIDAPQGKLVTLDLGRSRDLLVGQKVLAVGNPFGLDQTLTIGVVSALGRELESPARRIIRDVIQTDAAINPGNSGGPLLDSRGRLIGINSAIFSPSGAYAGIGFAIPVDTVKRLADQLIQHGRSLQPGIGVTLMPDNFADRYRLDGVVIRSVTKGGPAAQAGIQGILVDRFGMVDEVRDRILAVNGQRIESGDDLAQAFEDAGVGGTVTLDVVRGRDRRQVRVNLVAVK